MTPAQRHSRFVSALLAAAAIVWALVGWFAVPRLITQAYRGESLDVFNKVISGRGDFPLEHYLQLWHRQYFLGGMLLLLALWGVYHLWRIMRTEAFARRFVGEAPAEALAGIRIVVFGILAVSAIRRDLPNASFIPDELRYHQGVMRFLYALPIGFESFVESYEALLAFKWITAAVLVLATLGLWTRWVAPLGAACYLVYGGIMREYHDHFFHTELIPFYLAVLLSFMPCADALSIDRLRCIRRGEMVSAASHPTRTYAWCRFSCWTVIALAYTACGLSKFANGGWLWWHADNMRRLMDLRPYWPTAPDWVYSALGLAAVLGELLFGLVLVSRIARSLFPPLMVGMHVGILLLQKILFLDLLLIHVVFYEWRRLRQWAAGAFDRLAKPFRRGRVPSGELQSGTSARFAQCAPAVTAGIIAAFAACWFLKVEFYPLTAWQMFSLTQHADSVEYLQTSVHYRDGRVKTLEFIRPGLAIQVFGDNPHLAYKYLDSNLAMLNHGLSEERRVQFLEVELWRRATRPEPGTLPIEEKLGALQYPAAEAAVHVSSAGIASK